jgi:hypothetical protein
VRVSQKANKTVKRCLFPLFALMLVMGAFFIMGTSAVYAAEPEQIEFNPETDQNSALLIVKEVWLTGDTLHISVTDSMGEAQTLELNLRDYAQPADEYVTVQATDSAGHTSNTIQFKNPYFTADSELPAADSESESSVPDGVKPFTPDGSGTVIDEATDGDGKEFFTVDTPDGNTFYLIVDRQRGGDNVYLLDAVSEDDLASFAKPGDGKSTSAIETPAPEPTPVPTEAAPEPVPVSEKDNNTALIAFVVIAVLAVGGIGYYFKIVRPKKNGGDDYTDDGFDDDTEADLGGGEDGEDE